MGHSKGVPIFFISSPAQTQHFIMLYELVSTKTEQGRDVRTYRNNKTGTETKLQHIYTDNEGEKWFGFTDLYKIPYQRMAMAKHITDLYTIGLSQKDILSWCDNLKTLARSNDAERYEKLYAKILEIENTVKFAADPVKQQLALCTVYILGSEERIDYFDESIATTKLERWKAFPDMVGFFLTWHTGHIQRSIKALQKISTTVSTLQGGVKAQQG